MKISEIEKNVQIPEVHSRIKYPLARDECRRFGFERGGKRRKTLFPQTKDWAVCKILWRKDWKRI